MKINIDYWKNKYIDDYTNSSGKIEYFQGSVKRIEGDPLFKKISETITKRGVLKPEEFISICNWKSKRQKNRYKRDENLKRIEDVSKEIIELNKSNTDKVAKSLSLLVDFKGVQVPVASAILTVLFPRKYCIIDYRVRRAIFYFENLKTQKIEFENYQSYSDMLDFLMNSPSINVYVEYLNNMRRKANDLNCTPRELEMAFWKFDEFKGKNNHNHT